MDAVTAFLQGDLKDEIYMIQPEGFAKGNKVCKLKKSLYGLKQASRIWNQKLDKGLKEIGLKRSEVDQCVYYKIDESRRIYVAIYVDDLIIFSNDKKLETALRTALLEKFHMKDIGKAKFVLGMRISQEKGKVTLDQEQHIHDMLTKFKFRSLLNVIQTMSS